MASLYGKHWIDMWADIPMDAVKEEWQGGLYGYSFKEIGAAIDYCGTNNKFPPTLPEFRELCKSMRKPTMAKALPRYFTPEEMENNKERLSVAFKQLKPSGLGDREWAKKILARAKSGEVVPYIALRFANEALNIEAELA